MIKFLIALLLTISVDRVIAPCSQSFKQDVLFMIDYSTSIGDEEWTKQIEFAVSLIENELPTDSRVAVMGFGWDDIWVTEGWLFGFIDKASAASQLTGWAQIKGPTYLEAAIEWILNGPYTDPTHPGIDWSLETGRKRLMIVMSDGEAHDDPCSQNARLAELNIETVVIGISSGFVVEKVECLVQDPTTDIIEVSSFNGLTGITDAVAEWTCSSDYSWKLSEIKSRGQGMFIEFVNVGGLVDDLSKVQVVSNMIDDSNNLTSSSEQIEQGAYVVLASENVPTCLTTNNPPCYLFITPMISRGANDDWSIKIEQIHTTTDGVKYTTMEEVVRDATFPDLPFEENVREYSMELKEIGYDSSIGSSYRRSCKNYAVSSAIPSSAGVPNASVCTTLCNTGDCGASPNVCDEDTGCVCANVGFMQEPGQCPPIPAVTECTVTSLGGGTDVEITWTSTGSWIKGYIVTANGNPSVRLDGTLTFKTSIPVDKQTEVTIASIGELENGSLQKRWSAESSYCTRVEFLDQPKTQISGYTLVNGEIQNKVVDDNQIIDIIIRLINSPTNIAISVEWEWKEVHGDGSETLLTTSQVDFPADATFQGADLLAVHPVADLGGADTKEYVLRLKATTNLLPNDPSQRFLYILGTPSELKVTVNKGPEAVTVTSTNTETEELEWWIWLLIVVGALACIIPLAYFGYKQHQKKLMEKKLKEEAEEELRLGEDGFYIGSKVPENQVSVNPLNNQDTDVADMDAPDSNFNMIHMEDENFTMEQDNDANKRHFGQVERSDARAGQSPVYTGRI